MTSHAMTSHDITCHDITINSLFLLNHGLGFHPGNSHWVIPGLVIGYS